MLPCDIRTVHLVTISQSILHTAYQHTTVISTLGFQHKNNQGICLWRLWPYFCSQNKKGGVSNVQVGGMHGHHLGYINGKGKVHTCTSTEAPLRRSCVQYGCCTAPSAPHTRPTQWLSRPPPIQKLGAENHILQLKYLMLLMMGLYTRNMSS